jgi:hypothetical protein
MEARLKQFLETNPNPVLLANNDGTVYYSNELGEPLPHRLGIGIGEKLPSYIRDFIQRVISRNSSENTEVKVGKRTYLFTFQPLIEEECLQIYGFDITDRKQEEQRLSRYNRILEGINRIFGGIVRAETEEEFGHACLSVALEVTDSQIGFIGEVRADGLLHDIAISDMGWKQCLMHEKTGHRHPPGNFIPHGLYGYLIDTGKNSFINDLRTLPG